MKLLYLVSIFDNDFNLEKLAIFSNLKNAKIYAIDLIMNSEKYNNGWRSNSPLEDIESQIRKRKCFNEAESYWLNNKKIKAYNVLLKYLHECDLISSFPYISIEEINSKFKNIYL